MSFSNAHLFKLACDGPQWILGNEAYKSRNTLNEMSLHSESTSVTESPLECGKKPCENMEITLQIELLLQPYNRMPTTLPTCQVC